MGTTDGAVRAHKRTHAQKCTQPIRPLTDPRADINMKVCIVMGHVSKAYLRPEEDIFPCEG